MLCRKHRFRKRKSAIKSYKIKFVWYNNWGIKRKCADESEKDKYVYFLFSTNRILRSSIQIYHGKNYL